MEKINRVRKVTREGLCEVIAFEQKPKRGRVLKIPKGNTFQAKKTIAMVP